MGGIDAERKLGWVDPSVADREDGFVVTVTERGYVDECFDITSEMVTANNHAYADYKGYGNMVRDAEKQGQIRQLLIDPIVRRLENLPRNGGMPRVLQAGCGTAQELEILTSEYGLTGTGIDICQQMLNQAVQVHEVNATFLNLDMTDMDRFAASQFSIVLVDSALRHLSWADVGTALSECNRVLKPGGLLVAGFREGDGRVWKQKEQVNGTQIVRYSNTCGVEYAKQLIEDANFQIEEIVRNPHIHEDQGVPGWITVFGVKLQG